MSDYELKVQSLPRSNDRTSTCMSGSRFPFTFNTCPRQLHVLRLTACWFTVEGSASSGSCKTYSPYAGRVQAPGLVYEGHEDHDALICCLVRMRARTLDEGRSWLTASYARQHYREPTQQTPVDNLAQVLEDEKVETG